MIFASLSTVMCLPEPAADRDLEQRVGQYLQTQQPAVCRRIDVSARLGVVTVQGVVRSFYERQLAIACIRRVAGVRQVGDLLVVVEEARPVATRTAIRHEVLS